MQYAADNYPAQHYGAAPGFAGEGAYQEGDYPAAVAPGAEDRDFYDEAPSRRRLGIMAIAGVFALVVVGTAGAFGYRALFGTSGSSGPPPVIKADAAPSKVVPATNSKDPKSGKLIYDRVADRAQDEKIVPREEQPVDLNSRAGGANGPQGQAGAPTASIQSAMGSGVVATEPKKVHTIAIRPDGTTIADATPAAAPAPAVPAASVAPAAQAAPAATRNQPPPPAPVAHSAPPPRAAAPAPSNAPLSLSPNAQPAPRSAPQTAAVAPPTQTAPAAPARAPATHTNGAGGYAVQVSSQRSEAEAESAFRSLQAKFPSQLGGKRPMIHRVDLGAKGIYYRAMIGPFGSSEEASQMCSSLKAAGGQCFVQKI
jgi:hypothetical protein